MTKLFGGRVWRASYSKKSYPHHYATEQQYFKSTHPRTSLRSSQKTINIISVTLLGRMHQYSKLFPKFVPRFKFGTRISTNLNLRYCKIRTQPLSQNIALYKGINGVVAFACYWLHWLQFIKGKSQFCIIRRRMHIYYLKHAFTTNLPENYLNHVLDKLSTF